MLFLIDIMKYMA